MWKSFDFLYLVEHRINSIIHYHKLLKCLLTRETHLQNWTTGSLNVCHRWGPWSLDFSNSDHFAMHQKVTSSHQHVVKLILLEMKNVNNLLSQLFFTVIIPMLFKSLTKLHLKTQTRWYWWGNWWFYRFKIIFIFLLVTFREFIIQLLIFYLVYRLLSSRCAFLI